MRKPDFSRMRKVLLLEGEPDFVPMFDGVDKDLKSAFLDKPVTDMKGDIEFAIAAGYDFIHIMVGLRTLLGWGGHGQKTKVSIEKPLFRSTKAHYSVLSDVEDERNWAEEGRGAISTLDEFERFPWPTLEDFNYSSFEVAKIHLPPQMKAIVTVDGVYATTWKLMGGETFYLSLVENPDLVALVFERVGYIQYECVKKAISFDCVGALRINDDIAYNQGLQVAPKYLRKHFFPWAKRVGEIAKQRDLPFIYHSDGNLYEALDDIIDAGFNALHPIQPVMDIRYLKKKFGDKLCLMGNIDMDVLARGTPEEIKDLVKRNLRDIAPGGGYVVGASNSIPEYIPLRNFNAMRETAIEYGCYPISI